MSLWPGSAIRRFDDLNDQEILALAISSEEDDSRIYRAYADHLRQSYPASAEVFVGMAEEEMEHRNRLIDMHRQRFGETIPLIRRDHVREFYDRRPTWLVKNLDLETIRREAIAMEAQARRFYVLAAQRTNDAATRRLLGELADAEGSHISLAHRLSQTHLTVSALDEERETRQREFLLQYVQPGLVGLMDGSVSTLAPLFAAAFATHDTWATFLIGVAASVGAGISMGFAEALSDDGKLTGRGSPLVRGLVSGIMTTLGGLGHAVPYMIGDFWIATYLAFAVVALELAIIAWIRARYMGTPLFRAGFQVVVGGVLVFLSGILIGSG